MSTPQTRPSTPVSAAGNVDVLPAGAGISGIGAGYRLKTRLPGKADGDMEYPGEDMGRVSGRCHTLKQAQAAVDAYVSGQRI
ncbi:MAG TPA: hypothetical protein VJ418_19020 [Streptosporangiaceae bacterium]|jgi:hypothetical protein|nr:hypothetical protein [Streptosporangiaceae bacterium]